MNIYSKNDILEKLASQGHFIDCLALDTVIKNMKIEAIFENENKEEFFDVASYDIISAEIRRTVLEDKRQEAEGSSGSIVMPEPTEEELNDPDKVLEDIKLSTGEVLSDIINPEAKKKAKAPENVQNEDKKEAETAATDENFTIERATDEDTSSNIEVVNDIENKVAKTTDNAAAKNAENTVKKEVAAENTVENNTIETTENTDNIADKTAQSINQNTENTENTENIALKDSRPANEVAILNELDNTPESDDLDDYDDINLLSESLNVQDRVRDYVETELQKQEEETAAKTPAKENAFKLDISEKTLNMIARSIAKKIAKYVGQICAVDANQAVKIKLVEDKNRELEEQNKKLKLLLIEANRNLNSFKPSFFGFYRFKKPKENKK